MRDLKGIFFNTLGTIGIILYYLLGCVLLVFPVVFVSSSSWIGSIAVILLSTYIPLFSYVFWIWGLINAIASVQTWVSVAYYICFAILLIPKLISFFLSLYDK